MTQTDTGFYSAFSAKDARFDGVFFIGVTSTGIYCRPVCTVKTPKETNCRFFASAEAAEKNSFRPCLRCRPELAPGSAPVDDARRISHLIVNRIEQNLTDDEAGLEKIAAQFELSSRQIRRILQKELGVSPIELIQTRRLLLAKQLLTETKLPVTDIAFSSGFSSLRRFNTAFKAHYRMAPTKLRKQVSLAAALSPSLDTSTVQLSYRPPYDWNSILDFLSQRTMIGAEWVTKDFYARTVCLNGRTGWIRITHAPAKNALMVEFTNSLSPVLPTLLARLRNLFDLTARPDLIAAHLMKDKLLRKPVAANPGLRVPGAFDGFELAVRAVIGQQVTVKAATTLSCRLVKAFGEKFATPFPDLYCLPPTPEVFARADIGDIARHGIVSARAKCIIALAAKYNSGELSLEAGIRPDLAISQLAALPGIGPWTAHYITMRALRWPDAFPKEDIVIRNRLGRVTPKQADMMSQAWRPWRSYAVMHIWMNPDLTIAD